MAIEKVKPSEDGLVSAAGPLCNAEVNKPEPSQVSNTDLRDLRDSLDTKRQLLTLLERGGYVKDIDEIKADVSRAISDLDEILQLLPDGELTERKTV